VETRQRVRAHLLAEFPTRELFDERHCRTAAAIIIARLYCAYVRFPVGPGCD
jgi:hypothetical protein